MATIPDRFGADGAADGDTKRASGRIADRRDLAIALGLMAGLVALLGAEGTGLRFHALLAVCVGVAAVAHVVPHWSWLGSARKNLAGGRCVRGRVVVDLALIALLAATLATGLIVSPWQGVTGDAPVALHRLCAILLLVATTIHVIQHRKAIKRAARRSLPRPWLRHPGVRRPGH